MRHTAVWRQLGLCTNCGGERDTAGMNCSACRVKINRRRRARGRHRDDCRCRRCESLPAVSGFRHCAACLEIERRRTIERRGSYRTRVALVAEAFVMASQRAADTHHMSHISPAEARAARDLVSLRLRQLFRSVQKLQLARAASREKAKVAA